MSDKQSKSLAALECSLLPRDKALLDALRKPERWSKVAEDTYRTPLAVEFKRGDAKPDSETITPSVREDLSAVNIIAKAFELDLLPSDHAVNVDTITSHMVSGRGTNVSLTLNGEQMKALHIPAAELAAEPANGRAAALSVGGRA